MKSIAMIITFLVAVTMGQAFMDNGMLKVMSSETGIALVTVGSGKVMLATVIKAESNPNGFIPLGLISDNGREEYLSLTFSDEYNGVYIYDIDKDYTVISMLKQSNSIKVFIINYANGDSDNLWGQMIRPSGYTYKYNRYF